MKQNSPTKTEDLLNEMGDLQKTDTQNIEAS